MSKNNISFNQKVFEGDILDVVQSYLKNEVQEVSNDLMNKYGMSNDTRILDEYIEKKVRQVVSELIGDSLKRNLNRMLWYGR